MDASRRALVANLSAALNTANARRPFSRGGRSGMVSFLSAWPTSELPLETAAAVAAANAYAARHGSLRGRWGAATAGLALGNVATLLAMEHTARRASAVYEQALVAGLGADYLERVTQLDLPGPQAVSTRSPGVVRTMRIRRQFAQDRDVSYGPAGRANLLDIWRRPDLPRDAAAPVVIQMPGGAWVVGSKQTQAYPLLGHLAERGWICVAINYRLSPRHVWPAHIVDVKRAIAWVRANIAGYGGDPNFIALTGGSAGGHLSSLAALTPNDPQWQPGFEHADTSVAAALPFYGAYDWADDASVGNPGARHHVERLVVQRRFREDPDTFTAASPVSRITPDAPPMFISHGLNDALIPVEQAREFARRLRSTSSAPVVYAELPGAEHGFDIWGTPRAAAAAAAAGRFLGVVWGDYRRRTTT